MIDMIYEICSTLLLLFERCPLAFCPLPLALLPPLRLNETQVRIILGLPLVLFLPSYALIATLFPRKGDLDGIGRIALSFGLSIAITLLLGLALNYIPFVKFFIENLNE